MRSKNQGKITRKVPSPSGQKGQRIDSEQIPLPLDADITLLEASHLDPRSPGSRPLGRGPGWRGHLHHGL